MLTAAVRSGLELIAALGRVEGKRDKFQSVGVFEFLRLGVDVPDLPDERAGVAVRGSLQLLLQLQDVLRLPLAVS